MASRIALLAPILLSALLSGAGLAQTDLARGFTKPPDEAKPHTWWHWMNGNITKEGITADLEAMKKIGLGGCQIFNVSENIPVGPVKIMSPEWRKLVKFAISEANRLGLEVCMHNCPGWSSSGGPWITPDHAMQMVVSTQTAVKGPQHLDADLAVPKTNAGYYRDIVVLAFPTPKDDAARIKDIGVKAGFDYRYNQQPAMEAIPAEGIVKREGMIDITAKVTPQGHVAWDVPEGSWTILRMGYTPTGAQNAPAPESGRGLECDKLSREAFDAHWAGMMGPVIKDLGPLAGKTLNNCLIDSYEMGGQNWTPKFREEFTKRRGYDPLLLLPAMAGRVVDSGEVSERFLWDVRRTIADLFADNYYTYFAETCHKNGMKASIEPYDGPFECLLSGRDADIPMGEFWVGSGETLSCKLAASVGHTNGRQIIGAESFTAFPDIGRWQNHPAALKSIGDLMYTLGINRYIIHRYAHQPWMDKFPGMTMGQWGTHFERTTTWWNQGSAWISYLARCQFLLQQGRFAADVCYFPGDAAPNDAPLVTDLKTSGYDYDACSTDVLLNKMTVKDGRLTLPDGMSYRLLVLPDTTFMTPRTLQKLRDLVQQGATIIGTRPERSPSLSDFPKGDAEVARLAGEMWGNADGKTVKQHAFGKGRVLCGMTPQEVFAADKLAPDVEFGSATGKLVWIHRQVDQANVYFVSNQLPRSQEVECTFRISGMLPELWHADTGQMEPAPVWSEQGGRTTVPIRFDPSGSVFVVFRKAGGQADHIVSLKAPAGAGPARAPVITVGKAVYEALDGAGSVDVTSKVASMLKSGQLSVSASNSAFGDPAYNHLKQLRLEYSIDGKPVSRTLPENATLELIEPGPEVPARYMLSMAAGGGEGGLWIEASQAGLYELKTAGGKTVKMEVTAPAPPLEIGGAWTVHFPPKWGAPVTVSLDKLMSWTDSGDLGVKYFSGTGTYEKEFEIPAAMIGTGKVLRLDLGSVKNIAEVTLNGKDLGIWWKPPFAADITAIAKAGKNTLTVKITNLWVNRLIGDEQLPDDSEWNGKPLKKWPQWVVDGSPRPVKERYTFTTWHHYTKDSPLMESGLIGPVVIRSAERVKVDTGSGK